MPTWPSGSKPGETSTDATTTRTISGARADINQAIINVNTITDFFNLGTPGASDDNKVLAYDDASGKIVLEAGAGGGIADVVSDTSPQLGGELDQNGQAIDDDSRNYQILGNTSSPASADFDSFSNTSRVHGVVTVNKVTNPANRVHSNPRLSMVTAGQDASGGNNHGRIRQNYVEGIYDLAGFDNTVSGFGRGHNGMFVSGLLTNSSTTTSNLTESSALTVTAQIDTADANDVVVTDMAGIEVQAYHAGSGSSSTNFYGFYYNSPAGAQASSVGATNHYSFYSEDSNAILFNTGHIQGKSFGQGSPHDLGTIASTASTVDIDYANGGLQKVNLTAAVGSASTVLNEPTNMNDGDVLYLIVTCTTGTSGQNGELNFKTSSNYKTTSQPLTATQGSTEQIFMFLKSGSTFLVTQVGGTFVQR